MSIFRQSRPKVQPARRTARPSAPFGSGILPPARQRFEPSAADSAWAAAEFHAAESRDWERRAAEAAALDSAPYGIFA